MATKLWNDRINNMLNILLNDIKKNNFNINSTINNNIIDGRLDLTHLNVISIDPINCTDADDAFSIWSENNNIHLMIHIADPTSYFNVGDAIFNNILQNGQTLYLSGQEPCHMFNDNIIEKCSLTSGIKNVITVYTIFELAFNESSMFNIISSKIIYGIISCNIKTRYSYEEAAEKICSNLSLLLGMEVARSLWQKRKKILILENKETLDDFIFSNMNFVIPKIASDNSVILEEDTRSVKAMKNMIGEFAIHANTVFANGLGDNNLFVRSLILPSNILNTNLSQMDILYKLIETGTSASYTTTKTKHELIGTNLYTHATSPLRRASDSIVHFLLKAKYMNKECPFNNDELENMASKLTSISKQLKNIQYMDNKLRTFQWMAEELEKNNNINIKIKVNSYKAPFLNILIISVNKMNVNISYTLKRKTYNILKTETVNIYISKVNIYDKFDEGTLPDLDKLF